MSAKTITFEQLRAEMAGRVGQPSAPSASALPNLNSALTGFLKDLGLQANEPVGGTLRTTYYRNRSGHLERLRASGRSDAYIANRKSLLTHWRSLLLDLDRAEAGREGIATPLQQALAEIFSPEVKVRPVARATGIPVASLNRWRTGASLRRGSEQHLGALERYFGMTPGSLVDLLPAAQRSHQPSAPPVAGVNEYRQRLAVAMRAPYLLKPAGVIDELRQEWVGLVAFKTASNTLLLDTKSNDSDDSRRVWALAATPAAQTPTSWVDHIYGRPCRTAGMTFSVLSAFIGWLQLPVERGGRGMSPDSAQTLAHLSDTGLLAAYVNWRIAKADQVVGSSGAMILKLAKAVCNAEHGYLRARPDIGRRVNISDSIAWAQRCDDAIAFLNGALAKLARRQTRSRHPFEPIRAILDLPNPMDGIADAMARMDADRPVGGGLAEAIWARDRLLMTLTASNPLRARNLRELTYRPDNTGQLHKDTAGGWRIFIKKELIKNRNGVAGDTDYDMPVQPAVWPHIERYLRRFRGQIASAGNAHVFVSTETPDGEMLSLNRRFETLSGRYFWGCRRVGPHSMRHIVATAIIKATGNFLAAALVLHDREATVRKHYGHLQNGDGARWLDQALGNTFRRM